MRKLIAVFLVLVLLLTFGCAAKKQAGTPDAAQTDGVTASAVSDVDKEFSEIDSIDSELSSEELDTLDSELNFEI